MPSLLLALILPSRELTDAQNLADGEEHVVGDDKLEGEDEGEAKAAPTITNNRSGDVASKAMVTTIAPKIFGRTTRL